MQVYERCDFHKDLTSVEICRREGATSKAGVGDGDFEVNFVLGFGPIMLNL